MLREHEQTNINKQNLISGHTKTHSNTQTILCSIDDVMI